VGGIQGQTGPQLVGGDNSPDRISARRASVVLIFDYSSTWSQTALRRPMLSEFCSSRRIWPGRTDRPRAGEINNSPTSGDRRPKPSAVLPGPATAPTGTRAYCAFSAPPEIEVVDDGDQRVSPGGQHDP